MPEVWPPPPEHQPEPPLPPLPEGGRDVLVASLIAAALLPVNAVLVLAFPHSAPPWWPGAFAVAFGGLLVCWMYSVFGGLLNCRSRLARLGLVVSLGTAGFCLLSSQVAHWLKL